MADFTITPIPYSGGSLIWSEKSIHFTRLNSNRFIYAFSQQSPDYKFYGIADVNNVNAPVPVVNIVKQRAFTGKFSDVRLVPLDSTRFVSFDGGDLYVYNTSTNDVVEELKIVNYGNQYNNDVRDRSFAIKANDGTLLEGAIVPSNTPGQYNAVLRRLTYDTTTKQFTITTNKIITSVGTSYSDRFIHLKRIHGSSNKFLAILKRVYDESNFRYQVTNIVIYDTSTDIITDITPESSIVSNYVYGDLIGFGENAIVFFDYDSQNAIEYNGTSFGSPFIYTNANDTFAIGDSAFFSGSFGVIFRKSTSSSTARYFRIVNRTGPNSISTSFPTNLNNGLLVNFPTNFSEFRRSSILDIFDPETLLIHGYNTTASSKQFVVLRFKP
jgi:hypothetical protein